MYYAITENCDGGENVGSKLFKLQTAANGQKMVLMIFIEATKVMKKVTNCLLSYFVLIFVLFGYMTTLSTPTNRKKPTL
jgi:hypothetical protein